MVIKRSPGGPCRWRAVVVVVVVVAFIYSRLLNRHTKSLLQEYLLGRGRGEGVAMSCGERGERRKYKALQVAVWRKSTDINTKDCQGLIQGAGLSLENKEDILDSWT